VSAPGSRSAPVEPPGSAPGERPERARSSAVQDDLARRLSAALGRIWGAPVAVERLERLSGGASRETWAFTALRDGEAVPLVLRRDPPGARRVGMAREARVLRAAAEAGVPVPPVVLWSDDPEVLGSSGIVMARVEGETIPRRILREPEFAEARPRLAAQCGAALAAIHAIPPDAVPGLERPDPLGFCRDLLDGLGPLGKAHPVFEFGLRVLEERRPPSTRRDPVVVHGDFRNGNLIVGPEGLRAVLDWELVHLGDPLEDLGWLCTKAWRFGEALPVGGFGTVADLLRAYEEAGGARVDRETLAWWVALGTLRWGIMCILQASQHLSGAVRSVELATIGRRVAENEWDLLELLSPPGMKEAGLALGEAGTAPPAPGTPPPAPGTPPPLHDPPDLLGLVEAVREFVEGDVMAATSGRVRFHARVAANALRIVERELALGPHQAAVHAAGLASLGVADEAELAQAIREGRIGEEALPFLWAVVRMKLEVANPKYLSVPSAPLE
jgi:aminoglycoside phosphotransferase (APT) family kinase protein